MISTTAPADGDPTRTAPPSAQPAVVNAHPFTTLADLRARRIAPDRYQILGEHGRGGLGKVSRAHDRELGRDVAIKELIQRSAPSEVRFLREALITARLEHPGIVPVHEAGRWPDGTPFYAMKLVAGRSLRQLLAERDTVARRCELLHHVIAVADAIAYAHGRNVIHRDLKPSNVIVGDFGETVVIDWGLAKELDETDTSDRSDDVGGLAARRPRMRRTDRVDQAVNDLTSTGSILGTPAYMAPEQARGERVDQRADVFAIGAMLWELCALDKVPPRESRRRHRILRAAGIDRDLITIIDKALSTERDARYGDAGAIAADLKSFKAGARIAARSYSLPAMLAHWTRRHRTLAISVAAVAVVAVIAAGWSVHNLATERDRADTALGRVESARGDLVLGHAELLLRSDPTAAVAALAGYHGEDAFRYRRILAEAHGRGVARTTLAPHSDTVWLLVGDPTGAIISVGEDHRIRRTSLTPGAASTTLASDVGFPGEAHYSPAAHLIAYPTVPSGISLLDVTTRAVRTLSDGQAYALQVSPDGSRLAALDGHDVVTVWTLGSAPRVIYRAPLRGAIDVRFAGSDRLVVRDTDGLRVISLVPGMPELAHAMSRLATFDVTPDAVATGLDDGDLALLAADLAPRARLAVCRAPFTYVRFVPGSGQLVFACSDGVAGIARYDAATHALVVVDRFPTSGPTQIIPDPNGRYVFVTDDSRTAYLYDTQTRLITHYDGNSGQPSAVYIRGRRGAPGDHGQVLIGEASGKVRVWDAPSEAARVVLRESFAITNLAFSPDSRHVVVAGLGTVAHELDLAGGANRVLRGEGAAMLGTRVAPDGRSIVIWGYDNTAEIWPGPAEGPGPGAPSELPAARRFTGHGGAIHDVAYVAGGARVVSVGDDGRLLVWSARPQDGDATAGELFKHGAPLALVEVLERSQRAVVSDVQGGVWDVGLDGTARTVRDPDGTAIKIMRASPDGRYLALGTDGGAATIYDTGTWRVIRTAATGGRIIRIEFDPTGREVAIASDGATAPFGHVVRVALDDGPLRWSDTPMGVRALAYAPDGDTLAVMCGDGGTWFYARRRDGWSYVRDHQTGITAGEFSPDGRWFASSDRRGAVVVRDLAATVHEQ